MVKGETSCWTNCHRPWMDNFFNTLCNTHQHKSLIKVRYAQANIKRNGFRNTCANFVHMVEPILMVLKAFDNKQPCMRKVWLVIKSFEHVLSLQNQLFSLPSRLAMWTNINFTISGKCWWSTYIMKKHFSIHSYWLNPTSTMM
jgi:hypothetical protein